MNQEKVQFRMGEFRGQAIGRTSRFLAISLSFRRFSIQFILTTATVSGIYKLINKYVGPKLHTAPPPPPRFPAYELLGLLEGASLREVRASHRRLARAAYKDVDIAIENFDIDS